MKVSGWSQLGIERTGVMIPDKSAAGIMKRNPPRKACCCVVEMVEMKDVEIPQAMQRAMAREAEAMREKRARIIKSEAELEASTKLAQASELITQNPLGLELRRMQMVSEVGAEQNTTTIILMPSEFVSAAKGVAESLSRNGAR